MEEFIQKNPGLRSRIAFHVSFPDYNELELCQIAQLMGKKKRESSLLRKLWENYGLYLDIWERKMTSEMGDMYEACWSRRR